MNATVESSLPLGSALYQERYIKTGRIPDEKEIRLFFAAVEIMLQDDAAFQLSVEAGKDIHSPEAHKFTEMVFENYHTKWEGKPVSSHDELCKVISIYEKAHIGGDARHE